MEFVGRSFRKQLEGSGGEFSGTIKSYDSATGFFKVLYEDGSTEELESSEIASILNGNGGFALDQSVAAVAKPSRVGRKPKKRRRVEIRGNSGNLSGNLISVAVGMEDGLSCDSFGKTLEIECGAGGNCGKNVSTNENLNGELDLNRGLNFSDDELDLNKGVNLNDGLDLNYGVDVTVLENVKRNEFIDLNLVADEDESENLKQDGSGVDTQKRGHFFDLNLDIDDDTKNLDAECAEQKNIVYSRAAEEAQNRNVVKDVSKVRVDFEKTCVAGNNQVANFGGVDSMNAEGTPVKVFSGFADSLFENSIEMENTVLMRSVKDDANLVHKGLALENQANVNPDDGFLTLVAIESSGMTQRGRNSRKRRKLSDSANLTTGMVLRRSTRRARATFSAQKNHDSNIVESNADDDLVSSPAVSAVLEEKPAVSAREESEKEYVLPPKLQLPPSSGHLNLDGIPILDFFSVYAFLRSFSTFLFLSPFELEDFVAALRCESSNILLDCIHVSLLQTLRKHLESLPDESSSSASNCLRSLSWDLLDLVTWPIFMVEYLLFHGSTLRPGFNISHLKLFESDYYRQTASVKIEILRCLCDDVIEVEAIRGELNKRTLDSEPNMDFDQIMKCDISKRRRVITDVSSGSCLTEEIVDETTDWNSDECCLCKMDGSLICCDGCPAAFHSRCVGVASSLLPEGDWYCPECVIHKDKPWMKVGKSIRGAELLGTDPYGRQYYSSCGYLLVLDSFENESSFNYYHREDFISVMEALKSSEALYSGILTSISKHWVLRTKFEAKCELDSQNIVMHSDFHSKGQVAARQPLLSATLNTCLKDEAASTGQPEEKSLISIFSDDIGCDASGVYIDSSTVSHSMAVKNHLASFEGSAETAQASGEVNAFKELTELSKGTDISVKLLPARDCSLTSTNSKFEQGKHMKNAADGCISSTINKGSGRMSERQYETNYVNYYSFARTASSVAEELTRKPSDKISEYLSSVEKIISSQLKMISNKSTEYCWANIQNLYSEARREKCGWCFSCKVPEEGHDCLFIMNDTDGTLKGYTSDVLGLRLTKNRKGHLIDIMCQIVCMEDRLHGLILGPWLNLQHSKLWRKSVVRASDITEVKHLLLKLESNLHRLALSAEWLKYVDNVTTVGSASHIITSFSRMSSKHGIAKRRARCSDVEAHPSANAASGLGLFWWRGGRLSRQLFNWKVFPRSLASKAARQGGCKKIEGILYPDSSEIARRSKYIAWRAAVESSKSVEQLAVQVRELDANIKWDDIENTNILLKMDKESQRSIRLFKKAIVRQKSLEGTKVKYLLDFGKRRFIPDIVKKQGTMLEESSSGRKKFWLEESHVPLHLLKAFEEKRIARKSNMASAGKQHDNRRMKDPLKKKGFSYLFSRAERSDNYQCGHCNKNVPIREAVCCQYCKGFFHKRHARKSAGATISQCIYTCHKCQDGKFMRTNNNKGKLQSQKCKKASKVLRTLRSRSSNKSGKDKPPKQSQKNKKTIVVVPLRRSPRKIQCVPIQSKKMSRGRKKGKQMKSRKKSSRKPKRAAWRKKRTPACHAFWLNGLRFSRKLNDERALLFRNNKVLDFEQWSATLDKPKCSLCAHLELLSTLSYICCEICGDWYHGDAFGLGTENMSKVIGFKCHKCLNRMPPVCPHLHAIKDEEDLLNRSKNEAVEYCGQVSCALSPANVLSVKKQIHFDEEGKDMALTDECSFKEKQCGVVSEFSSQTFKMDEKFGRAFLNVEKNMGKVDNSNENDHRTADLLESNDNVSLEHNTIELRKGHDVGGTAAVETDTPLSKSNDNVHRHRIYVRS